MTFSFEFLFDKFVFARVLLEKCALFEVGKLLKLLFRSSVGLVFAETSVFAIVFQKNIVFVVGARFVDVHDVWLCLVSAVACGGDRSGQCDFAALHGEERRHGGGFRRQS